MMKLHVSLTAFRASLFGSLGLAALTTGAACDDGQRVERVTFTCTPTAAGDVAPDDGFELCQEGYYHRVEQASCALNLAPFACNGKGAVESLCQTDNDCGTGQHCLISRSGPVPANSPDFCSCAPSCSRDEECGLGGMCDCQHSVSGGSGDPAGRCLSPDSVRCRVDADCGAGSFCASYTVSSCGGTAFACLRLADECVSDEECRKAGKAYCGHDGGHRLCLESDCVVGRPFRVESEDRVAPLVERDDWARGPAAPDAASLPPGLRAELGAYWAKIGQMEHASVAAFARFALQLLALGAPPELVAGAQAAMGDELEHARLCFGLASTLAGRAVGPGPLSLEGAFSGTTLAEVVRLAVVEGCVGETLAALEAAEAGERAGDPGVLAVLGRVRVDEARHAELAWRFVAWAIESGGAPVREAAREAFVRASGEAEAFEGEAEAVSAGDEGQALAFGRLPERVRRELRRRGLREVVRPCAERLLASGRRAGAPVQSGAMPAEA
jgi:hypothetical protein